MCVGVFESHDPVSSSCFNYCLSLTLTLNDQLSLFFSLEGLDLRIEHFHCFSDHGEGGHYHYDVTPDDVQYTGFFSLAEKVYRIDRPQTTHNVGRD